jgi:hypothetical protein
MQNYRKTIGALAAASALVAGNASAEVEYEIHTGYTSEYIWRGQNLGADLTEVGLDMATEYNGIGLSAGLWYGSFHKGGTTSDATVSELDLYGEASKDLGFATAAIGYISYMNFGTNSADDAQEVYFSLAQTYFGVDFSLAYYWDIETDNDGYTELAASKGFELSPCLTLNTGAALGYLWEQSSFVHLTAKVALDYAFTETATISPFIAHTWAVDDEGVNAGQENEFVGGTMLSVSF